MDVQSKQKNVLLNSGFVLDDEIEINFRDVFNKIYCIRTNIYKAAIIGLVIGLIVALSIPKKYTVKVTLSPEIGNSKGNSGLTGLAASFLGSTPIGENVDALNVSLSSEIVSSTPFLMELLTMEFTTSTNNLITLKSFLYNNKSPWWNYIMSFPSVIVGGVNSLFKDENCKELNVKDPRVGGIELNKEEYDQISYLKKNIVAVVDKKTAITNISVTLQDPMVAAVVADSVVYKLQQYIINYRTFKAKEDCLYLDKLYKERQQEYYVAQRIYAEYVDAHDDLVFHSVLVEQERLQNEMNLAYQVYTQVANQLQMARAKVQEEKPVFAIVEPAVIPLFPSSMGMKMYIIIFVLIAVLSSMVWVLFIKSILNNLQSEIKKTRIKA